MKPHDEIKAQLLEEYGEIPAWLGGEIRPHDLVCTDEHLTEQEHIPNCDVNRMVKSALRGQAVLTNGREPVYGYDDTTMDGLTLRVQKAHLEKELTEFAQNNELSEEELKLVPEKVQQKFKLRKKAPAVENAKNDDSTTKNATTTAAVNTTV